MTTQVFSRDEDNVRFYKKMTPAALNYIRHTSQDKKSLVEKINRASDSIFPRLDEETEGMYLNRISFQTLIEKKLWTKGTVRYSIRLNGKYRLILEWKPSQTLPSRGSSIHSPTIVPVRIPSDNAPINFSSKGNLSTPSGPKASQCLEVNIIKSDRQNN